MATAGEREAGSGGGGLVPADEGQPAPGGCGGRVDSAALEGVSFGYLGGPAVVSGVTGGLVRGRVTAIVGPNAAGKSTLLKLIAGLLVPTSGAVHWGGSAVGTVGEAARARRVVYVPQRGSVAFGFTVREVVAFGGHAAGGARGGEAVEDAMRAVGVEALAGRAFNELSGGQQQAVVLARAWRQAAGDAAGGGGWLWLLDEAFSAMDLKAEDAALRSLRGRAAGGDAVVVVLHDLSLAAAYADDAWVMDGGRLVAAGPAAEVLMPVVLEPVFGVALERVGVPGGGAALAVRRGG